MLQVGDTLPAATVFLGPGRPLTLLELVEDGPKLIVFYPFDWSSTCTNEMELVRDRRADFEELGVQPVGISRDSPWCAHRVDTGARPQFRAPLGLQR